MKKKSKWGGNTHGAYCSCEDCSKQDFNIHQEPEVDCDAYEVSQQFAKRESQSDGDLYIDNIERYFGE